MPKKSKKKASFIPEGFKAPNFIPAGFKPPAPAPAPARKSGYSCDYSRFDDVLSDDSDAERQALAKPEALRRGGAARGGGGDVAALERELGHHVSTLSARGASSWRRSVVLETLLAATTARSQRARATRELKRTATRSSNVIL